MEILHVTFDMVEELCWSELKSAGEFVLKQKVMNKYNNKYSNNALWTPNFLKKYGIM
jgi:hypothetical protein